MDKNDKEAIENFLLDIESLDRITAKLSNFNVFETLNLVNMELKHSNVLGWLMTPNENHGLDDKFLKKFIQMICKDNKEILNNINIELIYLSLLDYSDVIVRREWNDIDILIITEKEKFVIVIENKILSKEHSNQLARYKEIVERDFKDYKKLYLYLTPNGDISTDEENWLSIDYSIVQEALENAVELVGGNISEPVKLFVDQYREILRRYIVGNSELETICRDIYYKHQKALDLIYNYKPDIYYDISKNTVKILEKYDGIIIENTSKSAINFTTKLLVEHIPNEGKGWGSTNKILLFEVRNRNDKLVLKLYIGPGKKEVRDRLYEISVANKEVFKGKVNKHSQKWTQIYSKDLLSGKRVEHFENNIEDINIVVTKKLEKLLSTDIKEIEKVLLNQY